MSVGVEHDSDVRLRLVVSRSRAKFFCTTDGRIEIISGDVEVHHHLLRPGAGGPSRRRDGGFVLKRETGSTRRRLEFHPTGLVVEPVPFQQALVEVRESLRIGSSEHRRGHLHGWLRIGHTHILLALGGQRGSARSTLKWQAIRLYQPPSLAGSTRPRLIIR
jgi:hypothetical protein